MSTSTESNPILYTIAKNTCSSRECSLCYKPITKTFFACSAPCNKIFHVSCMEQSMEQTEQAAWEADEDPQHKCSYCRRQIDVEKYMLHLMARRLFTLKAGGHEVSTSIQLIKNQLKTGILEDDDFEYAIYEIRDTFYVKKPKQSKRAECKKKPAHMKQRITIKHNIGGRRR